LLIVTAPMRLQIARSSMNSSARTISPTMSKKREPRIGVVRNRRGALCHLAHSDQVNQGGSLGVS
jgi:hypothetical protein